MKKMKRFVALALVFAVMAAFCACGPKQTGLLDDGDPNKVPEEAYEINWYLLGAPQEDEAAVEAAINEYLKDKINATVNITMMESGQYKQKMGTMIQSQEYFDIAFAASWMLDYSANAALGAFVALDEYYGSYLKDAAAVIPADFLDSAKVGEARYGLPVYKEGANQYGFIYRKDIAEKYNIDMSKVKTLEDFEPIAEMLSNEIKAGNVDIQYPIDWDTSAGFQEYMYDYGDFVQPVQNLPVGISYCEGDDPTKIISMSKRNGGNIPDDDIYLEMRKYYKNGWVKKDTATAKDVIARLNSGKTFCYVEGLKPGKAVEMQANCPYPLAQSGASAIVANANPGLGSMQVISATSKNPGRCARFLNLLNTDPVLKNLVIHGIEGKHYTKVSDTVVDPVDNTKYTLYGSSWSIGNVFNDYILPEDDPNKLTDLKKFNEEAIKREASSFTFDPTGLEFEIAEIGKIGGKYGVIGAEGSVDLDYNAILEAREKEYEDAGLQKIIDAMQTQYDAYLASK